MSCDVTDFQDCSEILCEQNIALTLDIHVGKGFVNPCNWGLVNKLKNDWTISKTECWSQGQNTCCFRRWRCWKRRYQACTCCMKHHETAWNNPRRCFQISGKMLQLRYKSFFLKGSNHHLSTLTSVLQCNMFLNKLQFAAKVVSYLLHQHTWTNRFDVVTPKGFMYEK